jgi:hypothetical protein
MQFAVIRVEVFDAVWHAWSNAFDEKPGNVMLHRSRELIAHNAMRELGRSRGGKKRRRFALERQPARQHHKQGMDGCRCRSPPSPGKTRRSSSSGKPELQAKYGGLDALLRHFYAPCWINREAAAPQELSAKVSRTAWLLVGHGGAAHLFAQSDAPRGSRKTTSRLTAIPINYRLHNKFDSMQQILI